MGVAMGCCGVANTCRKRHSLIKATDGFISTHSVQYCTPLRCLFFISDYSVAALDDKLSKKTLTPPPKKCVPTNLGDPEIW